MSGFVGNSRPVPTFEEQNHRTQSNSDFGLLKRKRKQKRKLMERKLKQSFGFGTLDLVSDVCFLLDFMPCCRSDVSLPGSWDDKIHVFGFWVSSLRFDFKFRVYNK
ncbi:unnamed protein product [Rhizophagus irregularis]|nr:unnamed protein product [Rhizophagus irregularis]CAB4384851.1 unnamed protein product [Rhizophagus irregularis]CAB4384888.1 unnamed protein product [Rhizophagus irregularis]CAB4398526.1 unnamed protein product [Rhizophagus irregularis]CAB5310561.1 unnamed protein product [Rhizophagus irregularis]